MGKIQVLYLAIALIALSGCAGENKNAFNAPKVGPQPDGSILVPSNQLLRPAGLQVYLPGRPVDLVLTPDENFLLVKNKDDLDLIRLSDRTIMQTLSYSESEASFTGICLSPDGNRIYLTDANDRICIAEFDKDKLMRWKDPIILPNPSEGSPAPEGFVSMIREIKFLLL